MHQIQKNQHCGRTEPKLFTNCTNITTFAYAFCGCVNLTSIPQNLFANNNKVVSFEHSFYNCTSVTGNLPELWNTHPKATLHTGCFGNCTQADNYEEAAAQGWS